MEAQTEAQTDRSQKPETLPIRQGFGLALTRTSPYPGRGEGGASSFNRVGEGIRRGDHFCLTGEDRGEGGVFRDRGRGGGGGDEVFFKFRKPAISTTRSLSASLRLWRNCSEFCDLLRCLFRSQHVFHYSASSAPPYGQARSCGRGITFIR